MVFWGFDETTFKQYMIVGPMQKEAVRKSKLRILSPFEKKILNFLKKSCRDRKVHNSVKSIVRKSQELIGSFYVFLTFYSEICGRGGKFCPPLDGKGLRKINLVNLVKIF